jgi:hypothetical protein
VQAKGRRDASRKAASCPCSGQLLSEVSKMKKFYEGIGGFVRWLLASIFSFIIVWPTWVSLTYEI